MGGFLPVPSSSTLESTITLKAARDHVRRYFDDGSLRPDERPARFDDPDALVSIAAFTGRNRRRGARPAIRATGRVMSRDDVIRFSKRGWVTPMVRQV